MREISPKHLRCANGTCCGVFEIDQKNLLVIGKKLSPSMDEKIRSRVSDNEQAIVIDREFFSELQKK